MDQHEREGGDITASDMILPEQDSDIMEFYKNSTIFITGATGFLGKLCLEKLLRTCSNLNKIYILIRPMKGKDVHKRFDELFEEPNIIWMREIRYYDTLHNTTPTDLSTFSQTIYKPKILIQEEEEEEKGEETPDDAEEDEEEDYKFFISPKDTFEHRLLGTIGDISLPGLGLKEEDKEELIAEVDCVMHFAATVRFDEKLRTATNINVRGVRDVLRLCRQMKKLRAVLHVSTAFSNCDKKTIDETFYEPPISGEKLITLVDCLDDEKLDAFTQTLLGEFPNTYAFTKCVAEDIVRIEGKNLPVAVYRPSIVIATVREPVAGWIDNVYSATGVLLGVAVGLLRTLHGRKENHADMVPADYVVNSCLAATWDVATIKTLNDNKETQDEQSREEKFDKEIPVYNFVSTPESPFTWDEFQILSTKHCKQIPSEKCVWHSYFRIITNTYFHLIATFFFHTIPAYFVDLIALCIGKKPMLVKGYQKINKFANVISYFCLREWEFKNGNTQDLWNRMKKHDKELFEFSMKNFNWDLYFYTYTRGARAYVLKDPLDTISKGAVKYYKLMIAHYALLAVLCYFLLKFSMFVLSFLFKI
ncbi:hypothetical protein NQ314_013802 [Rhamnusium bicolor]|uniref:Fatty acyl-CoA reductase n=1 Tax=Rhamnusium bicolor TaxID=1586634 RepID=A0AAV8X586_9CUCU|nr:hypothetical protein NQ314_013802 [Rhamnusium bicolor]